MKYLFSLVSTIILLTSFLVAEPALAQSARVSFSISFQDIQTDLRIMTTTAMPGDRLAIRTQASAQASTGKLERTTQGWRWLAPESKGVHELTFSLGDEQMILNVFVLTPFANGRQDSLSGYRVGRYATTLFRGLSSYAAPTGFIDLADAGLDYLISPNFTLGQFICKQQPGHDPTYLLVNPRLLVKLETLLEAANEKGWQADTFFVMSGFRTPYYNTAIGNTTTSSRHLYGGAADIWIDNDGDGQMDDLNGDGRITFDDARELGRLANSLSAIGGSRWPPGGIGIYRANSAHGPFVHIDARGYKARW